MGRPKRLVIDGEEMSRASKERAPQGVSAIVMKELMTLPVKTFPTCHLAADGHYYDHEGNGQWRPFRGTMYVLAGTDEQKAEFRLLAADPDAYYAKKHGQRAMCVFDGRAKDGMRKYWPIDSPRGEEIVAEIEKERPNG